MYKVARCPPEEGELQIRTATVNDAQAITDIHIADNPYGGWFRNPIIKRGPCGYEELTQFQRMLHGGDWMDVNLCRRHINEYITRGYPILVAEEKGKVVGECELWLADEPKPFVKYSAIEMLMVGKETDKAAVELALVEKGEERCSRLGPANYDVSPQHGGDGLDWQELGFKELRDTRTCRCDLRTIEEPDFDFTASEESQSYDRVSHLLAWNHHEPSELAFGLWPPAKLAGFDRHSKRLFMRTKVESFGLEFFLHADRPDWLPEEVTMADIWSNAAVIGKADLAQTVIRSVAATVGRLGEGILEAYVPKHLLPAMRELGFGGGEKPDLWLRKRISSK